jgi:hypothetical protein
VINGILEQWDALSSYFSMEASTEKVDKEHAKAIDAVLKNIGTKPMLTFLSFVLRKVDRMNVEFQATEFRLHEVFNTVTGEYRSLLQLYIKDEVLQKSALHAIDPSDPRNFVALKEVDLGGRTNAFLAKGTLGRGEERLRSDALNFLTVLCENIRQRFDFSEGGVLSSLRFLDPRQALARGGDVKSLAMFAGRFPNIVPDEDLDTLQEEWSDLKHSCESLRSVGVLQTDSPPVFWSKIGSLRDGMNQPRFATLTKLAHACLSFPHSNAAVERIFSKINRIKTSQSNRMLTESVKARIQTQQALKASSACCVDWVPSKQLVRELHSGAVSRRCKSRAAARLEERTGMNVTGSEEEIDNANSDAEAAVLLLR